MDGPGFPQAFQQAAATTQANKVNTCAGKWASTWLADVLLSRGFREAFARFRPQNHYLGNTVRSPE